MMKRLKATRRWLRHASKRARQEEHGVTLIELLIAAAMLAVVTGTIGMVLVGALHQQPRIADRSADIAAGRQLVERLTRELREGSLVTGQTASQLTFRTYVRNTACGSPTALAESEPAIECRVKYSCSSGACTRKEFAITGSEPAGGEVQVVSGLHSNSVFTYSPASGTPEHVSVTLVYPSEEGEEGVTISDGAQLRNTG